MLRTALGWLQIATVAVALLAALDVALLRGQPANARVDLSAYFGGSGNDSASLVSVDEAGNYYLAGSTDSRDFPVRDSIFPLPPSTGTTPPVGFLTKLRADGSIVYSRYLPRPLAALAVDAQGNATIADNVPAFLRGRALGDFVISKLDANGTELYSVRFAGSGLEQATALALDETGAVVITGNTDSPDFPLVNPLQPAVLPGDDGFDRSAFVTRLDALGRIVFSTGWGGTGEDLGRPSRSIAQARSPSPERRDRSISRPAASAFQRTLFSLNCSPFQSPCADAFVTRFSADGRSVIYSTLFGGTNAETVSAAAVDAAGSVHVAGTTASPDLPLRRAIQTACDNGRPINQGNACSQYIVRLNPGGTALEYSTYFGSRADYVNGAGLSITSLAADGAGARACDRRHARQRPSAGATVADGQRWRTAVQEHRRGSFVEQCQRRHQRNRCVVSHRRRPRVADVLRLVARPTVSQRRSGPPLDRTARQRPAGRTVPSPSIRSYRRRSIRLEARDASRAPTVARRGRGSRSISR